MTELSFYVEWFLLFSLVLWSMAAFLFGVVWAKRQTCHAVKRLYHHWRPAVVPPGCTRR